MKNQPKAKQLWQKLLCLLTVVAVSGQSGYYDNNYPDYEDYQDYAQGGGEQGYDDHLYHDYAARQQEKVGGGGGYVRMNIPVASCVKSTIAFGREKGDGQERHASSAAVELLDDVAVCSTRSPTISLALER